MIKLMRTLKFILKSPLNKNRKISSIVNYIRWQLVSRAFGGKLAVRWIDDSRLLVGSGEAGLTGNVYSGLMEFDDMAFLLCGLKEHDLFVDIGANVGAYTVLASKVVGATSVTFEPVAETYDRLLDQIYLNRIGHKVRSHNVGVGETEGVLRFTVDRDTTNRVTTSDLEGDTVEVDVITLDGMNLIQDERVIFVKIDVEGFEMNVLRGGRAFFMNERVRAVIIELNGSGALYGYKDDEIHKLMESFGFNAVEFDGIERNLHEIGGPSATGNTIYVRDRDEMTARCVSAPLHKVHSAGGVVF